MTREIQCSHCNKRFIIPEERVPQKDTFQIICPKCHNRFMVFTKERGEERSEEFQEQTQELVIAAEVAEQLYGDAPLALVCENNPSYQDTVKEVLESLGYTVVMVGNPEEARERMKFVQYEVVFLNDEFGNGGLSSDNTLLNYLQFMPMSSRRNIFLVLCGKNLKTMDNLIAFVKSVNLVINLNDLSNLKNILRKSIEDNRRFQRIFKDCLRESGKI